MSSTTNQLAVPAVTGERAMYGPPTWTVIHSATATALAATVTGVTQKQHWVTHVTLSFSAAPSGALTLQIKDGTTVIWQVELSTGATIFTENFETRPLHATKGADLVIAVGSAGGSVVQTISASGYSTMSP